MPRKFLALQALTLVLAAALILTQQVWASPLLARLNAPATASSKTTVNYQGFLTDSAGNPVNDTLDVVLSLYALDTGGAPLWTESQTGVPVSDGLFSVLLGSVTPLPQTLFAQNDNLWLGIAIGADAEMTPRDKLASAPYAMAGALPSGVIVMWSGSIATVPAGWQPCDGANGTPDLRDRFVVGAGASYAVGSSGGASQVALTTSQLPAHTHSATVSQHPGFEHSRTDRHGADGSGGLYYGMGTIYYDNNRNIGPHTHTVTIDNAGGNQAHENRPPYYAVAFICKN